MKYLDISTEDKLSRFIDIYNTELYSCDDESDFDIETVIDEYERQENERMYNPELYYGVSGQF